MRISCLIVDDQKKARDGLVALINQDEAFHILGTCSNGAEAIMAIRDQNPDVVFLDIQMPDINGFDVLANLDQPLPVIVFVTAHDDFALKAFESHALDYLLKPFTDERFTECLNHLKKRMDTGGVGFDTGKYKTLVESNTKGDGGMIPLVVHGKKPDHDLRLVVKEHGKIHFLAPEEVVWVEAFDYYVKIHLQDKFHVVRDSMKHMSVKLPPETFVRIHKSSIINMQYLRTLHPVSANEYEAELVTGQRLKVSRNYKKDLLGKI